MPLELAERVKDVKESVIFQIIKKAKEMQKAGKTVYRFDVGEPDFPTPENIKNAAKKALDENFTYYTPAAGIPELKKAVCAKLKRVNNLDYTENEVIISTGGKQALYNMMQALLGKGDEAILPKPYWISHLEEIKLADAKPVLIETDEKFKLHADAVEEAITKKTKLLILNSPSNPTGAIIDRKELEKIADLAIENNFYVCSDEVYEAFTYDGKKIESIASFNDEIKGLTITVNAVSKAYSMTGWRIGYAAGPKNIIEAMASIQSHSTSNPTSIAQKAAVEALNGQQDSIGKMRDEFDKRRKFIVKRLNEMKGIECNMPEGAFYVFPKVSALYGGAIKSSLDFCNYMLEKGSCSIVPGLASGTDEFVRLSYASSMETIEKGMAEFGKAVKNL